MKTLIFDFDGTIADTLDAAVGIYNRIAPSYGCRVVADGDRLTLRAKRPQEFLREYGVTFWKLPFLALKVRKELKREIEKITPISGVLEVIRELSARGYRMGVLTSNSKENVERFLVLHGVETFFQFIYSGRSVFGKHRVMRKALKQEGLSESEVVYVGDETRDVEAAKRVGISIISVSWGFNTRTILEVMKPDYLIDRPTDLLSTLELEEV